MKCLTEKRVRDGVSRYRIKRQTLDRHKDDDRGNNRDLPCVGETQ